jgi:6,7-dimethyl-8-ribityllumazine synthase
MASEQHNLSSFDVAGVPSGKGKRFAVIVSEWNSDVTGALCEGCCETLKKHGVDDNDIIVVSVPGSYELIFASAVMMQKTDAVIAIGCVIRGDTPHFDYICQGVTNGLAELNAKGGTPVIFGLLTCDTQLQAEERAGGRLGNKGSECAVAALKMANIEK